jgi:hypothetical protein
MPDPELESLKRAIDLAQYARSIGYIDKPRDSMPGIVVLEHQRFGDRIAVAHCERGGIYARVPDYTPRAPGDPEEAARIRLRDAIMRSSDTGSIVEFVGSRERMVGRPDPDLDRIRDHLAAWHELSLALGATAGGKDLGRRMDDARAPTVSMEPPAASEVQARLARWQEAQRTIDRKLAHLPQPQLASAQSPTIDRGAKPEMALRRYDWSPDPTRPVHRNHLNRARSDRGDRDRGPSR